MNPAECRRVLVELNNAFPATRNLGSMDDQVALWMQKFGPISIEDMSAAVLRWIDTSTTMPTVRQFRVALEAGLETSLPDADCMCDGTGYYEAAPRQWIPCPACLPSTSRRWSEGHYAPGHWCDECARVTRNEGPSQIVDERKLVQRPNGRKLTREENLDRLRIVQQVVAEMKAAPKWNTGMTRAEIDKHWEDRFNTLMQGDSDVDPEVVRLFNEDDHFVQIPDTGPGVPDRRTDDEGFEIL